ncbi:MAG TPA: GNAT family N-acetyltransferase [Rhizomicrobium sp.]
MRLALETDADGEVLNALTAGVKAFNAITVPDLASRRIVAAIRDEAGRIAGGVVGSLAGDSIYLDVVYTDDSVRGTGLGREAMLLAEAEAKRLGAREAWLYTMSFQAKPFYEKLGYSQFAELEWLDGRHRRHFMRKDL